MPLPIKRIERTLENAGFSRVPLAEMVGFEPTCLLITDKTISSVVRLWQIHGWSRSFQVALSRAGNPGTARSFGHSDPYLPEAI